MTYHNTSVQRTAYSVRQIISVKRKALSVKQDVKHLRFKNDPRSTIHPPERPLVAAPDQRSFGRGRGYPRNVGFTMVELLTSVVIFGVMAIALYMVFDQANLVWRQGSAKTDQYQNVRTALQKMAREIASAVIGTGGPDAATLDRPYLLGQNASASSEGRTYDLDKIYFISSSVYSLYEVGFEVNNGGTTNDEQDDALQRNYTSPVNTDFTISIPANFGTTDDFALRITDLEIKYIYWDPVAGEYTTSDTWDSRTVSQGDTTANNNDDGRLPQFIQVGIQAVTEEQTGGTPDSERQAFSTTIALSQKSFNNS